MREEDLGRYQMLWDCPACGASGLLGLDHKFCPSCGTPQDPKSRYFPSDEQKILVEDHPYHGADKVCPACETPNAAPSEFCQACGSPLDDAKAASKRDAVAVAEGAHFAGETAADARAEAQARKAAEEARRIAEMSGRDPDPKPAKKGGFLGMGLVGGCLLVAGVLVLVCAGFFALSWMFQSTDQVSVVGHTWKRSIEIESFGPKKDKAWRDELPRGAVVQRCRDEKRSTKKVPDGEDCKVVKKDKGDGTFSEKRVCEPRYKDVDVMAERCTYTVNAWAKARTEQAAGTDLSPRWPTVKLAQTGECVGCEREGKRTETLSVVVKDSDGTEHTCTLPETRWRSLEPGQSIEASFGGLTGAIDCSSL